MRWPFTGLGGDEPCPERCVFVAVMLGSTSFDGFSRTTTWSNLISDIRADLGRTRAAHGGSRDDAHECRGADGVRGGGALTYLGAVRVRLAR